MSFKTIAVLIYGYSVYRSTSSFAQAVEAMAAMATVLGCLGL